jgi:hypothetical protein
MGADTTKILPSAIGAQSSLFIGIIWRVGWWKRHIEQNEIGLTHRVHRIKRLPHGVKASELMPNSFKGSHDRINHVRVIFNPYNRFVNRFRLT